mmetsp:Transcript_47777/g.152430  ORF Transcript_47777/g.152430 Transcript_47777/m.152430 type:complete len:342 (-) Transcript_47777:309-1334(-)
MRAVPVVLAGDLRRRLAPRGLLRWVGTLVYEHAHYVRIALLGSGVDWVLCLQHGLLGEGRARVAVLLQEGREQRRALILQSLLRLAPPSAGVQPSGVFAFGARRPHGPRVALHRRLANGPQSLRPWLCTFAPNPKPRSPTGNGRRPSAAALNGHARGRLSARRVALVVLSFRGARGLGLGLEPSSLLAGLRGGRRLGHALLLLRGRDLPWGLGPTLAPRGVLLRLTARSQPGGDLRLHPPVPFELDQRSLLEGSVFPRRFQPQQDLDKPSLAHACNGLRLAQGAARKDRAACLAGRAPSFGRGGCFACVQPQLVRIGLVARRGRLNRLANAQAPRPVFSLH